MTRDGLDAEGYIEICGAVEKIPSLFLPVLDGSIALLKSAFEARLHSIYLYGSVATGHAGLSRSDIDILVIFTDSMSDSDRDGIKRMARNLSASYPSVVREVGLAAASYREVFESPAGLGCFIKHLCVCVEGEDIRPLLPEFCPSADVACGFNGDYPTVMQARLDELAGTNEGKNRTIRDASDLP